MSAAEMDEIRLREAAIDMAHDNADRLVLNETLAIKKTYLPKLTDEELLELAEECGAEKGPKHCFKCLAWEMYCERTA